MSTPHEQLADRIEDRAAADPAFAQAFLDDPEGTLAREFGPGSATGASGELTDEQLEDVAGGTSFSAFILYGPDDFNGEPWKPRPGGLIDRIRKRREARKNGGG